jgi:hypothetical protein
MAGLLTMIYLGLDLGYLACGASVMLRARRPRLVSARRMIFLTATVLLGAGSPKKREAFQPHFGVWLSLR